MPALWVGKSTLTGSQDLCMWEESGVQWLWFFRNYLQDSVPVCALASKYGGNCHIKMNKDLMKYLYLNRNNEM